MKLEHMQELLLLEQYKNFTIAAERAFITQPSLSRHIVQMEKELGTVLVLRDTHQVEFTQEGKEACETFRQVLHLYDSFREKIAETRSGVYGNLALGMLYYTISQDFGESLPHFQKMYPNIRIQKRSFQPQEVYLALLDRTIDIGVIAESSYGNAGIIQYTRIAQHTVSAMVPKNNRLFDHLSISLKDLVGETILLLREDYITTTSILDALARCGFSPSATLETDHIDTVPFALLESGALHLNGSGFEIPGYEDSVRVIPVEEPLLYLAKSFAYLKDNHNPAIRLFLDSLRIDGGFR